MKNFVTDLKFSKRNPGRVQVYLDHRYAFTANQMDAAALAKGQHLEAEYVERMTRKHEEFSAYVCAIRFLGYRQRSCREVDRYLTGRKGFARETVDAIIQRLGDERYLDDTAFARLFVESRIRHRPRSCGLLRRELYQKGIDDAVIDAVLSEVDEEDLAWRSVESKLKQWIELGPAAFKIRLIGFLQRRGFPLGIALKIHRHTLSSGD